MSKTGNLQAIVSTDQIKHEFVGSQSLLPTISNSSIEDKLDESTSALIKSIFNSYVKVFDVNH